MIEFSVVKEKQITLNVIKWLTITAIINMFQQIDTCFLTEANNSSLIRHVRNSKVTYRKKI